MNSILTKSNLPVTDFSVNPYTGCEHKCEYCYASFMKRFTNHSEPWGEFVDVKQWQPIKNPQKYADKELFIGSVTDPYQPLEQMQGSGCKINGEKSEFFPEKLRKNELLTSLDKEREYPLIFYYLPLVFQKKSFGYAALVYNFPQCYDISLRDFIKTAVNSLEFLRMKNDIHYLSQCQRESSLYDALTGFYNLKEFREIVLTSGKNDAVNLLAVNFSFADDREYVFGETYRSDIIVSAAAAIKKICVNHEVCCRTDNGFIIMHGGGYFPDKLKAAMQCETAGKFTERQVVISYADIENAAAKNAVGDVLSGAEEESILTVQNAERRKNLPHYDMLLSLKNEIMISPHKVCDIESVSRRFCISEGYFRTIYKNCFGISYVNDCINARLSLAKYLLCTSSMSIYAIAMKCGYADEKYFSRQFKENAGCSPLKYRNN